MYAGWVLSWQHYPVCPQQPQQINLDLVYDNEREDVCGINPIVVLLCIFCEERFMV